MESKDKKWKVFIEGLKMLPLGAAAFIMVESQIPNSRMRDLDSLMEVCILIALYIAYIASLRDE